MTQPVVLRVLVVDDEKPARMLLASMLSEMPEVRLAGCVADGGEALDLLAKEPVDLVFLDIEMPGLGGLEVARRITYGNAGPRIVFVTAFSDFAVEAFELNALDFLLKPFLKSRLEQTLKRAREEWSSEGRQRYIERMRMLLRPEQVAGSGPYVDRFQVQADGAYHLLLTRQISVLEAADHYSRLWSDGRSHLVLRAISTLESELDPAQFVRIHRTKIVNLDFVKAVRPNGRDSIVEMKDGSQHGISRGRQELLKRILDRLAHRSLMHR